MPDIPDSIGDVNENSSSITHFSFQDESGSPITPLTFTYRIDSLLTGNEIRDDTVLVPTGSTLNVNATPSDNVIESAPNQYEYRRLTATWTTADSQTIRQEVIWRVVNLAAV